MIPLVAKQLPDENAHTRCPGRLTEHRVWSRFRETHGILAQGVPRERRHGVLKYELRRVVVRDGMVLRLEWWR